MENMNNAILNKTLKVESKISIPYCLLSQACWQRVLLLSTSFRWHSLHDLKDQWAVKSKEFSVDTFFGHWNGMILF